MTFSAASDNAPRHIALLVVSQIPGLGPARIKALLRHFGDFREIHHAAAEDFSGIPGIGLKLAESIAGFLHNSRTLEDARKSAERQLSLLDRYGATFVTIDGPLYPPLLREIYDPPPYLFIRGNPKAAHTPCISVVGTRQATQYGRKAAEQLCRELVSEGFTVVSGLAHGIDTAAHMAALNNNGKTIAVLAGGVENPYTDPSGKVWPRIVEEGALVSEEWFGSTISPAKFPKRNRLIAGLSKGTVIVESNSKGGSLITASYALDQNREVFAVPGSIFSRTSDGPNSLIAKGHAKLVTTVSDIVAEIGAGSSESHRPRPAEESVLPVLSPEEKKVLDHMDEKPIHIDILAEQSAMDPSLLLVHLFELELKQLVEQQPGQMFRRNVR